MKSLLCFTVLCASLLLLSCTGQPTEKTFLFVGSYTDNAPDTGIYVFEFDENTGDLALRSSVADVLNPSFLTISADGKYVYACSDSEKRDASKVLAFAFDKETATLKALNSVPSGGENPVYVATTANGKFVAVGNYTGGSAAVCATNADGSLQPAQQIVAFEGTGPVTHRQEKAHIHAAVFSPDDKFLLLPDLGADKIRVLPFSQQAELPLTIDTAFDITTTPGSGPRHIAFHPNGKWLYNAEELSGMVAVYAYAAGKATLLQRIFAYSKKQEVYNSADIHLSPDGKFLYVSNRWEDENTIAIFAVDSTSSKLTFVAHQSTLGKHPRNFALSFSGKYLLVANMHSNEIVVFSRDSATGLLTDTGKRVKVANPSCLQFK